MVSDVAQTIDNGAGGGDSGSEDSGVSAGLIGAGVSVVAWGAGSVMAKGIDMDPLALASYRFTLFSVLVVLWMSYKGTKPSMNMMRHSMIGGIALGLDIAFFFSAVKLTNIVNATLIGSLQPLIVGVIAVKFFGETISRRDALLSLGALAGVGMVMLASTGTPEWSIKGDALAFMAMFTWSAYFIASKQSRGKLTTVEFTTGTAIWCTIINLPLAIIFGQDLSWPSSQSLWWIVAQTAVAGVLGHFMMNWSLVRIPLWVGSTFTLLIPITSALIAWATLGEAMVAGQFAAMLVVFASLALVIRGQAQAAQDPVAQPTNSSS